ncbi:MAG: ABC transporter ATP-binding protein, partial [Candidatus Bipolaricaulota bacterium]
MSYVNGTRITVESLSVRYADREELALRDVSEQIDPGEVVVVSGASGCGKSTLCKALCKFIPEMIPAHVEGEILIDGLSIRNIRSQDIATQLGLVQQDPDSQICTLNVWQEVAFGPENLCLSREEVRARVEESLLAAGISHLVNRETTTLSGGEKQRLAIASILAMRPSVVLLDEPTANLDPQGAKAIF